MASIRCIGWPAYWNVSRSPSVVGLNAYKLRAGLVSLNSQYVQLAVHRDVTHLSIAQSNTDIPYVGARRLPNLNCYLLARWMRNVQLDDMPPSKRMTAVHGREQPANWKATPRLSTGSHLRIEMSSHVLLQSSTRIQLCRVAIRKTLFRFLPIRQVSYISVWPFDGLPSSAFGFWFF